MIDFDDGVKGTGFRRFYGIDGIEERNNILKFQDGCGICGTKTFWNTGYTTKNGVARKAMWNIDHDHRIVWDYVEDKIQEAHSLEEIIDNLCSEGYPRDKDTREVVRNFQRRYYELRKQFYIEETHQWGQKLNDVVSGRFPAGASIGDKRLAVRGILCTECNSRLGECGDSKSGVEKRISGDIANNQQDPLWLGMALEYLETIPFRDYQREIIGFEPREWRK